MAEGPSPPGAAQASPSVPARAETSPPRADGPRDRLAQAALDAALGVEGVAGLAPSGLSSLGHRFAGIDVVAEGRDRYGLTLHLAAHLVPLIPLADAVRDAVATAARRDGLAGDLGRIDVRFETVEPAR
ncbi:MAG TPA: hypothetical protein VGW11_05830 [Solirubrobacteraceae bacterium]|nr:hypothetical protein [Solirubrobacteraceae bacterium]